MTRGPLKLIQAEGQWVLRRQQCLGGWPGPREGPGPRSGMLRAPSRTRSSPFPVGDVAAPRFRLHVASPGRRH